MTLHDYTGTIQHVEETIYPDPSNEYYLQDSPTSISAIVAYAITDIHNPKTGADIQIENEYEISIHDTRDTFIKVSTSGTISSGTLKIQHKEGISGSWTSPYTPTNPQLISGVSYSFDSDATYALDANWEFKIWELEPVTYSPVAPTQLFIDLTNGKCYTTAESDYDRIVLRYDSYGSIIRLDTLYKIAGQRVFLQPTLAPSASVIVTSGAATVNGYVEYVQQQLVDLRDHISFNGETNKHAYVCLYLFDSGNQETKLGSVEGTVQDIGTPITYPAFPAGCFPLGIVEVETDSTGSVIGIETEKIYSDTASGGGNTPNCSTNLTLTNFYSSTIQKGTVVSIFGQGYIAPACPDNVEAANSIGVASSNINGNAAGSILTIGSLDGFSGLTTGTTYYLTSQGQITKDYPSSGSLVKIGVALGDNSLFVQPCHIGVLSTVTYLLEVGGTNYDSSSTYKVTKRYNPSTNTWSDKTDLTTARHGGILVSLVYSAFLLRGIEGLNTLSSKNEEFYNNSWTTRTAAPQAIAYPGGCVLLNEFYTYGGANADGSSSVNTTYKYTPRGSWSALASFGTPEVDRFGSVALNNKAYLAYGIKDDTSLSQSMREYSPDSNSWVSKATPPTPVVSETCMTAMTKTKAYLYGGIDSIHNSQNFTKEYESTNDIWTSKTHKSTATHAHGGGKASDGVYSVSGQDTGTTTTTANERYDSSDTWVTRQPTYSAKWVQGSGFVE